MFFGDGFSRLGKEYRLRLNGKATMAPRKTTRIIKNLTTTPVERSGVRAVRKKGDRTTRNPWKLRDLEFMGVARDF